MSDPNRETADYPVEHDFADSFFAPFHVPLPMVFGAASHVGKVRSKNEDHFAVFRRRRETEVLLASLGAEDLHSPETYSYAMVVVDGMGGMKSGEVAARLALQTMVELSGQATSWVMRLADLDAQQIAQRAKAYVQRIHATIQSRGRSSPNLANMGTTWTSAHFLGRNAVVVHLGDSRAYLYRGGQLHQITRDETMAQSLIDSGMEPETVRKFRHVLLNSFGGGNDSARAKIHHVELVAEDQLLLCSDGLYDMVRDVDISAELGRNANPQAACDALVQLALDNGGKDNVTVVLAKAQDAVPD